MGDTNGHLPSEPNLAGVPTNPSAATIDPTPADPTRPGPCTTEGTAVSAVVLLPEAEIAVPSTSSSAQRHVASPPAADKLGSVLEGVVAFVEVRHEYVNSSRIYKKTLLALGATVVDKMSAACTHLVFKDGTLANYKWAKKLNLHIVSATWVHKCRTEGQRLNESSWPCVNKERYESPGLFPKIRKLKSMNPIPDDEFDKKIEEKVRRARMRREKKEKEEEAQKQRVYGVPSLV